MCQLPAPQFVSTANLQGGAAVSLVNDQASHVNVMESTLNLVLFPVLANWMLAMALLGFFSWA